MKLDEHPAGSVVCLVLDAARLKLNEIRARLPGIGGDVDAMNIRYILQDGDAQDSYIASVCTQAADFLEKVGPNVDIPVSRVLDALRSVEAIMNMAAPAAPSSSTGGYLAEIERRQDESQRIRKIVTLNGDALIEYLKGLKNGERVVETSRSALYHRQGTVYRNETGSVCVMWDKRHDEEGHMGTSVTGGARRVNDVLSGF